MNKRVVASFIIKYILLFLQIFTQSTKGSILKEGILETVSTNSILPHTVSARVLDVTSISEEDNYDDDSYDDPKFPIHMPTSTASYGSPPTPSRTPSRSILPTPSPSKTFVPSHTSSSTPSARLIPESAIQIQLESITNGVPDAGIVYILSMSGGGVVAVSFIIALVSILRRERQKQRKFEKEKEQNISGLPRSQRRSWSSEDSAAICAGASDYRVRAAAERIQNENPKIPFDEITRLAHIAALHSNTSSFIMSSQPQPFAYLTRQQQMTTSDSNSFLPLGETMTTHTQGQFLGDDSLEGTLRFQFPTFVRVSRDTSVQREKGHTQKSSRDSEIKETESEYESHESEHSRGVWVVIDERISAEDINSNSLNRNDKMQGSMCVLGKQFSESEKDDPNVVLPGQNSFRSSSDID
jgi:hypothetical protein